MSKYLAIYNGNADERNKSQITPEQSQKFMEEWAKWAQDNKQVIIDPGSPLSSKKEITANGIKDAKDTKTGYTIVEAQSLEAATQIFSNHPHLTLFAGNFIEVLECPSIPEN